MNGKSHFLRKGMWVLALIVLVLLAGCTAASSALPTLTPAEELASTSTAALAPANTSTPDISPTTESLPAGLTAEHAATLNSLTQIDDYPLYTMHYQGEYDPPTTYSFQEAPGATAGWACSLFAALGNPDALLYGRNFDWQFSPAVLLFTDPPGGYASVSMVDIDYLGFGSDSQDLTDLPLAERTALLDAPYLPFDGMNETGLAIGMAAVPVGGMRPNPDRETVGSLGVIRLILDQAATVDEAVDILQEYNIDMQGGPPLHYLVADARGQSVLAEFHRGAMEVIPNEGSWQAATNFLQSAVNGSTAGYCTRYDHLSQMLDENSGQLNEVQAIGLLSDVAQGNTQWSVVYEMSDRQVNVVMGQNFEKIHTFRLGVP